MIQEFLIRFFADYAMLPVVLIGAYALVFKVPRSHRLAAYSRILMAGLMAYFLAKAIGSIYQPMSQRPFEILGTTAGASFLNNAGFPSDHILLVTAIVTAVWFETKQKLLTIILLALLVAISAGRVLALVHTPLDVIGGFVIAAVSSLWYINRKKVV